MKKKLLFTFLLLITSLSYAQIPAGYYNEAIGKHGHELKAALAHIIEGHNVIPFGEMQYYYHLTDCDPERDSLLIDIYGECRFAPDATNSEGCVADSCIAYDKEHAFCQSWMGGYDNSGCPSFSDFHHIFPVDCGINRSRGNCIYGEVDPLRIAREFRCGTRKGPMGFHSQHGNYVPYIDSGSDSSVFEPIDEYKGDIARALFYVSTRYMFEDSLFSTSMAMTYRSQLRPWAVEMLLRWNTLDPVSPKEIARNNAIYGIQHNRNPYIDHPELVNMIFGNDSLIAFSDSIVHVNRPRITAFEVNDVNSITVRFDSAMVASTITDPANYAFSNHLTISEIELDSVNQVTLHLAIPITIGVYYYCIIGNGQAQNGIFMSDTACTFVYGYSPYHTVFVGWTFDNLSNSTLAAHAPIAANCGPLLANAKFYYDGQFGSSTFTYDTSSYSELRNYGGTNIGDPRTQSVDGRAFSIQSTQANGKAIVLKFSTINYTNLLFTYARRITSTGFKKYFYEWSTDGTHFTPVTDTLTADYYGAYELQTIDLQDIEEIELQPQVFLRLSIDGAATSSSFDNGNVRFDNFCVHGQKCVSENVILHDTIQAGQAYTAHGFNIQSDSTLTPGTTQYDLQVQQAGQCDTLYTLFLTIVTGVPDSENPEFQLFPNPATSSVTIHGRNVQQIELYDCVGKLQQRITPQGEQTTWCVNELRNGIYMVRILTRDGRIGTRKLIIRK